MTFTLILVALILVTFVGVLFGDKHPDLVGFIVVIVAFALVGITEAFWRRQ